MILEWYLRQMQVDLFWELAIDGSCLNSYEVCIYTPLTGEASFPFFPGIVRFHQLWMLVLSNCFPLSLWVTTLLGCNHGWQLAKNHLEDRVPICVLIPPFSMCFVVISVAECTIHAAFGLPTRMVGVVTFLLSYTQGLWCKADNSTTMLIGTRPVTSHLDLLIISWCQMFSQSLKVQGKCVYVLYWYMCCQFLHMQTHRCVYLLKHKELTFPKNKRDPFCHEWYM